RQWGRWWGWQDRLIRARPGWVADRVQARPRLGGADLPAACAAGGARAAAGLPQTRRPAAEGPGCGGVAGDQPEHGAEGVQGAGDQGPDGWPARPGHVRSEEHTSELQSPYE